MLKLNCHWLGAFQYCQPALLSSVIHLLFVLPVVIYQEGLFRSSFYLMCEKLESSVIGCEKVCLPLLSYKQETGDCKVIFRNLFQNMIFRRQIQNFLQAILFQFSF